MAKETALRNESSGTVSSEITPAPELPATALPTLAQLTEDTGHLNNRVQVLHEDTADLHSSVIMQEWQSKSTDLVRQDMQTLLGQLADNGFAWRDIARLIGVSVPAVQKWRQGGTSSGQSRLQAAAVLAACELISEHYLVRDIASWFEVPVVLGYPVTALDLYAAKHVQLVFSLATGNADPEQVLSAFDPDWRENFRSEFEAFQAEDGPALRPRTR